MMRLMLIVSSKLYWRWMNLQDRKQHRKQQERNDFALVSTNHCSLIWHVYH